MWIVSVAAERINQMIDLKQSLYQAMADYKRLVSIDFFNHIIVSIL